MATDRCRFGVRLSLRKLRDSAIVQAIDTRLRGAVPTAPRRVHAASNDRPGHPRVRRAKPSVHVVVWCTLTLCCVVAGCVVGGRRHESPVYVPPSDADAHANVKLRLVYHASPAANLEQTIEIERKSVVAPQPAALGSGSTIALRVRPAPTWVSIGGDFYDLVDQSTTKQYHVERVSRARCAAGAWVPAKAGETYLVQFDFFGQASCSVSCKRQISGTDAPTFEPCQ